MRPVSKCDLVKKNLRDQILDGKYLPQTKIPTEPDLVRIFKVGRNTVREAVVSLVHEGLLNKIQGRGTFVADDLSSKKEERSRQIGLAYSIRPETFNNIRYLQDYVLEHNGLLTLYNVGEDAQDPLKEKMFLEKIEQGKFDGVILLPTPIEPLNGDVYKRIREAGIKVALIAPYKEDMDNEVTFFFDYFQAGYMTVSKMAKAGFNKVCLLRNTMPIYYKWFKAGISRAACDLGLEMLDDIVLARVEGTGGVPYLNPDKYPVFTTLPEKTGLIASQTSLGYAACRLLTEMDVKFGEDIAFCARVDYLPEGFPKISCLISPEKELLTAAVDYVLDAGTGPTEIIHKLFRLRYEENGTLEKKNQQSEKVITHEQQTDKTGNDRFSRNGRS